MALSKLVLEYVYGHQFSLAQATRIHHACHENYVYKIIDSEAPVAVGAAGGAGGNTSFRKSNVKGAEKLSARASSSSSAAAAAGLKSPSNAASNNNNSAHAYSANQLVASHLVQPHHLNIDYPSLGHSSVDMATLMSLGGIGAAALPTTNINSAASSSSSSSSKHARKQSTSPAPTTRARSSSISPSAANSNNVASPSNRGSANRGGNTSQNQQLSSLQLQQLAQESLQQQLQRQETLGKIRWYDRYNLVCVGLGWNKMQ